MVDDRALAVFLDKVVGAENEQLFFGLLLFFDDNLFAGSCLDVKNIDDLLVGVVFSEAV